jgi:hypothetical protein
VYAKNEGGAIGAARGNRRGAISEGQFAGGAIGEGQLSEGQSAEGQLVEGQLAEGQLVEGQLARRGNWREGGANGEGQFLEGQTAEGQLAEWQSARGNCPATSNYSDCSLRTCCCSRAATCAPMQFENLPLQPGSSHVAARVCNCMGTAARERHGLSRFCFEMRCQATIVRMHMYCSSARC